MNLPFVFWGQVLGLCSMHRKLGIHQIFHLLLYTGKRKNTVLESIWGTWTSSTKGISLLSRCLSYTSYSWNFSLLIYKVVDSFWKLRLHYSGCYISFYHHLPIRASKVQKFNEKHLPEWHFYLPLKERVIFCIESLCPQYTFSLPDSGSCYFLVFQNACLNLSFTCPRQSGK